MISPKPAGSSGASAAIDGAGPASTELVIFHAAIPAVLLVAGLYAELVALSGVHRAAKWITVTVLSAIFAVTLIASYIAVLAVVTAWNPHAPTWVNAALAAVPDAAMVMAGTVILSLRMRRHGLAPVASPTETIWAMPWSVSPAVKMSPLENVLALTTATTGPR